MLTTSMQQWGFKSICDGVSGSRARDGVLETVEPQAMGLQ